MVLDVVRRLIERRLQELVVTGIAQHPKVPHSARSRAGVQRYGRQLTCAIPGHSE